MMRLFAAMAWLTACGGPPPGAPGSLEEEAAAGPHRAALGGVHLATRDVRGALAARDAAARRAQRAPTPEACRAVLATTEGLADRWERLAAAYTELAARSAWWPDRREAAEARALRVRRSAEADAAFDEGVRAFCHAAPPVARVPEPAPVPAVALCGDLRAHGALVNLIDPAPGRYGARGGGLAVARRLSRRLADELDLLFVLVHDDPPADGGQTAGAWIERGTPGLGRPAHWDAGALPAWTRLRAAVVLRGDDGLRRGPSLRGVALAYANRLTLPGCSPRLDGGWGYSDVGGQLGGQAPGAWIETSPGDFRIRGGAPLRLVGGGGNGTPFAPLEQYLMGLVGPDSVGEVRFLRDARPGEEGAVRADGQCVVDGPALAARFGERPREAGVWRAGVVVVSRAPLPAAEVQRYQRDLAAFAVDAPDDAVHLYNFHEATGGRGRLIPVRPALRPGACAEE